MLRSMIEWSVPDTGTLVFDNFSSEYFRVGLDARGDIIPVIGVLARDQVLAGFAVRLAAHEKVNVGSNVRRLTHDSQTHTLHAQQERFTQELSPRPPWRGPIEAY